MRLTSRPSGWRFQIRIPRGLEPLFEVAPVRLNLGPIPKRPALRVARSLADHAEALFRSIEAGERMAETSHDDLVEDLHAAYWPEYGGGVGRSGSIIELTKLLIDPAVRVRQ